MNVALESNQSIDQIAYCSLAIRQLNRAAFKELYKHARQLNKQNNITGLLMTDRGVIIQWIEGPAEALHALWEKIQHDPRHHCIVKLVHREGVNQRLFPNWSMQRASRNEMAAIIREARQLASNEDSATSKHPWHHAISTLSILIDPDFSPYYVRTPAQQHGNLSRTTEKN